MKNKIPKAIVNNALVEVWIKDGMNNKMSIGGAQPAITKTKNGSGAKIIKSKVNIIF